MGFGSRAILAGGLGFTVAFVVACGNSTGLLSSGQSTTLANDLHSVSTAVASHDCARAQSAATALNNDVANLPSSLNSTLLNNLGQGAGTVSQLATRDCGAGSSSSSSTSSTTSSTPSSTTTTTSTPTSTTTSTPTSTSTTTTTITPTTTTSSSATNPPAPGTSTTGSGGAGLGGGGTASAPSGGNGQ